MGLIKMSYTNQMYDNAIHTLFSMELLPSSLSILSRDIKKQSPRT